MRVEPSSEFDAGVVNALEAARNSLVTERQQLDASVDKWIERRKAEKVKGKSQADALRTVLDRGGAMCHDMQSSRNCDEWSLSFAYLVQTSLAYLAAGKAGRDANLVTAMLTNLGELARALRAVFPSGRRSVDEFLSALAAMGNPGEVSVDDQPHPHKDSVARHVLVVRDTGYGLAGFRTFYIPSGRALHVVRPA